MSSYVVNKEVIDSIVNYVSRHRNDFSRSCFNGFAVEREELRTKEKCNYFGKQLWHMNFVATHQRYPDLEPDELPGPIPFPCMFDYELTMFGVSAFRAYDCISTLVYQCSEGTVPSTDAYQSLLDLQSALCREALESCSDWKEYNEAKFRRSVYGEGV